MKYQNVIDATAHLERVAAIAAAPTARRAMALRLRYATQDHIRSAGRA